MLPAMVLAAGLGTRLRPVTDACAKALVPVGDRPALAHVLDRLRGAGAAPVVVNAHHRAEEVRRYVDSLGAGVRLSEEKVLLGTAGGVARATPLLGEGDVIVWNADILADVEIRALVRAHEEVARRDHADAPPEATLVVEPRPPGQGPVGMDRRGSVVRLRAERFGEEAQGGAFLGISVLGAALRRRLPEAGCLVADAWLPLLREGGGLTTFVHTAGWCDIGTVRSYLDANLAWLRARARSAWAGAGARVAPEVSLDEVVLGEGAVATGAGTLARCVVWAGAQVRAPLADAVVLPSGQAVHGDGPTVIARE